MDDDPVEVKAEAPKTVEGVVPRRLRVSDIDDEAVLGRLGLLLDEVAEPSVLLRVRGLITSPKSP